jgi:hypothetical protein
MFLFVTAVFSNRYVTLATFPTIQEVLILIDGVSARWRSAGTTLTWNRVGACLSIASSQ